MICCLREPVTQIHALWLKKKKNEKKRESENIPWSLKAPYLQKPYPSKSLRQLLERSLPSHAPLAHCTSFPHGAVTELEVEGRVFNFNSYLAIRALLKPALKHHLSKAPIEKSSRYPSRGDNDSVMRGLPRMFFDLVDLQRKLGSSLSRPQLAS